MYVSFRPMESSWPTSVIADDILVIKDDTNPEWMWTADISQVDGKYLTLYVLRDTSRVLVLRLPSF